MNQLQRKTFLWALQLIGGLMLCVQPVLSSEKPPREAPPSKETVRSNGQTMTKKNDGQEDLARKLAEQLASLGITSSPSDASQLTEAIAKGGSAGMALAQYLVGALAEIDAPSSSTANSSTPASRAKARDALLDHIIDRLSKGDAADLDLAHIVRAKLIKLSRKS